MEEKIAKKKPCGIFLKTEHPTNMCLILQEDVAPVKQNFQSPNFQNHNSHHQPIFSSMALEDIASQLATYVGCLESQGKLPGHTENNLKHNVSVLSLRSGKSYGGPGASELEKEAEEEYEEILVEEEYLKESEKEEEECKEVLVEEESKTLGEKETPTPVKPNMKEYKPLPPFPSRLKNTKREREDAYIMEILHKVEVNLPLLDVIKHIPQYAKFLKILCISKKKNEI
uniref:Retrotransposon gag protein n=1 Tax=Lactuca sativa TaxID=4236 RepID=A0A9R1UXR4_LACSA|nr:hypothetical protein LSAT_V11C700372580 [Lactuca sativa]